jgi:hypothetical protein
MTRPGRAGLAALHAHVRHEPPRSSAEPRRGATHLLQQLLLLRRLVPSRKPGKRLLLQRGRLKRVAGRAVQRSQVVAAAGHAAAAAASRSRGAARCGLHHHRGAARVHSLPLLR